MTIAVADQAQLSFIAESEWGVTPETPTMKILRLTSESLKQTTQIAASAELRADRNVANVARTSLNAEGELAFEFSALSFDAFIAAALMTTSGATMKNGTTYSSFSIERKYNDLADTAAYYLGMMVNTMNLTIPTSGFVTGTFGMLGKSETSGVIANAYTDADTTVPMTSMAHTSSTTEGGSAASLIELTLAINNNLRGQPIIGTTGPSAVGLGKFVLTGTSKMYFENVAVMDKYLNFTSSSLGVTLSDGTTSYAITIPAIKYTSGQRVAGGESTDIIADMQWQAFYDSSEEATIKIVKS